MNVRRVKVARAASTGGVGATIGAVLALGVYAADLEVHPSLLLAMVVVGYVLGAIAGIRWKDDDDFPEAPPPRMHY